MSDAVTRLNTALEGRYSIERELGEGGMANVYLADDLRHERKVAVKVLKPELAAVVGAERFLAEIKTTANLQHPHILPLFDSGEADGFLFYVMPYVEGETLRDRLDRERQLPVEYAVRLVSDLVEALDHAHRKGVIHRDIKPANILLQDERPIIADFGIALAVGTAGGTRLTETGLSLGTPYYMSPEQAVGDQSVTAATDIYALGCVLYEALVGEPPFPGASAQAVLAKIIAGGRVAPRDQRPAIPRNVDGAIRRALERLPADRFASAGAFGKALTNPAFRYGETEEGAGASRTWLRVAAGVGVGSVIGLLAGMWLFGAGGRADDPGVGQERPLQLTFTGQASNPSVSPDGTYAGFVDQSCSRGQVGECSYGLFTKEIGATQAVQLVSGALFIGSGRWSHDGSSLVFPGALDENRVGLFSIPRTGGAVRPLGPLGAFDTHPSGDSVVVIPMSESADQKALIIEGSTGRVVDSLSVPEGAIRDISWAPDGERFAVLATGQLVIVGRDGETLDSRYTSARSHLRWAAGGDAILFFTTGAVREDDFVRVGVNAAGRFTGEPEVVRAGIPTIYRGEFDVARETGRVVLSTGDARRDLWSFDIDGSDAVATRRTGGTTWYSSPAISGDGSTAFYQRGDALGDNVYALSLTDGTEEALTAQTLPGGSAVRLSVDGLRLAYTFDGPESNVLEYIEFPSRRIVTIPSDLRFNDALPFGDGEFLLLGSGDGTLRVLDAAVGAVRSLELGNPVHDYVGTVSPEGSTAAFLAGMGETLTLQTFPLDGGEVRTLDRLEAGVSLPGVQWVADGSIYVGRWLTGDEHPSLWRWSEGTGALDRIVDLPVPCLPSTITTSDDGRRALCQVVEDRFDIWAFEGLGR